MARVSGSWRAMPTTGAPMRPASLWVSMRLNSKGSAISDQSRPISWSRARSLARACASSRLRASSSWVDFRRRNARTFRMRAGVSIGLWRKSSAPDS